jgi:ubiquinone/menaquinone biosynthesis C-methylase UbiE
VQRRPVAARYQDLHVAEDYDRRRFHSLGGRYNNWRLLRLLKTCLHDFPTAGVALDVACGTGRIDACLLRARLRVIALDISTEMLAVARRKVAPAPGGPHFLRADAHYLPFRSKSVDATFSIRFLHLMNGRMRRAVLTELARVTRQRVVVEYRSVTKPLRTAKRAVIHWLTGKRTGKNTTLADITDELARCGLVVERCYFVSRWFSGSVLVVARTRRAT